MSSAIDDKKVRQLIARQEIFDADIRYCRGVNHLDEDLIRSAYHPDSMEDHGFFQGPSADFIAIIMRSERVNSRHIMTNHYVEFDANDENLALCEYVCAGFRLFQNDDGYLLNLTSTRHLERFERRNGEWRIAHRRVVLDFVVEGPAVGQAATDVTTGMLRAVRGLSDPSFGLGFRTWGDKTYPPVSEERIGAS